MSKEPNPLFEPQREKVGAETSADYAYQYHWALYRIIQEHKQSREYAVFVELHEDVVISDSLNGGVAKFEFNQVKTIDRIYNAENLVKQKEEKVKKTKVKKAKPEVEVDKTDPDPEEKEPKNSVLGKLLKSTQGKKYTSRISCVNLVSLTGFKFKFKIEGLELEKISLADIEATDIKILEEALKKEIGLTELPSNLFFVVPQLSEKSFRNDIIAEISKLITALFPGSQYNSVDIYRALIDDLNNKGMVTCDFDKWDDVLERKALTSTAVTSVINEHTSLKNEAAIETRFVQISTELGLNTISSGSLRKSFDRYRLAMIGNRSVSQLDLSKELNSAIQRELPNCSNSIATLIELVKAGLPKKVTDHLSDDLELRGAIICEYIMNS
jgi:hypothetical protein